MPLKPGASRTTISSNIRKLKREHPDWSQKRVVAAALNNARRTARGPLPRYLRRKRPRPNPTDDMTGLYVIGGLLALIGIGTALYFALRQKPASSALAQGTKPSSQGLPVTSSDIAQQMLQQQKQQEQKQVQKQQQVQQQQQQPQPPPPPQLAPLAQQLQQLV